MKTQITHPQKDQVTRIAARIGGNVRAARKRRGWTQQLMASKIGISTPTYREFEAGKETVSQAILFSALLALDMEDGILRVADPEQDAIGMAVEKRLKRKTPDNDF